MGSCGDPTSPWNPHAFIFFLSQISNQF